MSSSFNYTKFHYYSLRPVVQEKHESYIVHVIFLLFNE